MKVTEIPVHCWNCGEVFYIEIANVKAGKLFCCDKCREDNLKNEIKIERERGINHGRKVKALEQRDTNYLSEDELAREKIGGTD